MEINFINNKKITLKPMYYDDINVELNNTQLIENAKIMVEQIFAAAVPTIPMLIQDENNNVITPEIIAEMIFSKNYEADIQSQNNKILDCIWKNTLKNYKKGLRAANVFISQANATSNMPIPSENVIYIPSDIKEACKKYLNNNNKNDLEVNTYFYLEISNPTVYFRNNDIYKKYQTFIKNMVNSTINYLEINTIQKFNDYNNVNLNLIEGILLRNNETQGLQPYSFERLLMKWTMMFVNMNNNECGIIIPNIEKFFIPEMIMLMNVESIAKAPANKIVREFAIIKTAIEKPYFQLPLNKIYKLSTSNIENRIIGMKLKNHSSLLNKKDISEMKKRKMFAFNRLGITKYDLSKMIIKIINTETNISKSENYSKVIKNSYMKHNRRNPDNYNIPGKSISLEYKPDIHLYIDTSGSISEENYKNAILTCITMAKKLNVNLYFNSFSHVLSECTLLKTKNKTIQQIYTEFQKIPKVAGGTDFSLVWKYIKKSNKRKNEISIMITDFAYYPGNEKEYHPKKLYYAPIDTSKACWKTTCDTAEEFCKDMYHIEPNIRKHILM